MREKNIPVDSVEIKEPIHAFAWEPIGSKFAIIHGEPSNNSVSFYNVKSGQAPILLSMLIYLNLVLFKNIQLLFYIIVFLTF
jgi:translation initiation factor 3 subunit B